MMMTGERTRCHPTVQIPPWPILEESTAMRTCSLPVSGGGGGEFSPYALRELNLSAFLRFLPSSESDSDEFDLADPPVDAYSCDEFRIYEFKVRRCPRGRSHDWTECPFAHPGEKARRRDPRKFNYSGTSCPEFRKGSCKKGDACEFAHGVFESWLHPARYRTQPCKDGTSCRRRVCFFAHTPEQLRVLPADLQPSPKSVVSPKVPESYDGSPLHIWAYLSKGMSSSPTSTLAPLSVSPPSDSPPFSPLGVRGGAVHSEMLDSMKRLQLSNGSWGMGFAGCGFGSPRGLGSVPVTPTSALTASRGGLLFPKIDREVRGCFFNGGESTEAADAGGCFPDVGWVSDLVK